MELMVFTLLAGPEIALAIRTHKGSTDKMMQRRGRLIVRAVQAAVVVTALLLPAGQKWRWIPVLGWVALRLLIAAVSVWNRRDSEGGRSDDRPRCAARTAIACILCILMTGITLMPAFVFTGYNGLPVSGKYDVKESSAILIDETRNDPFEKDGSRREVPVHFYYPSAEGEQFPLVMFSHGAFGYYQSNTSTYMELASNGYVVAALDHPHHAFFTKDTDGRTVIVDRGFMNTAVAVTNSEADLSPEEELELYRGWMEIRKADMNLAVNEIKDAKETSKLNSSWFLSGSSDEVLGVVNMTDNRKIGLMGHSMGGATSVALGRERDDIDAVIDMDGTMLSEYTGVAGGKLTVNEEPYEVPVLEFTNWDSYNELAEHMEEFRAEGGHYPNDELMRHAKAGFTTTIRDTKHMDFTDLPLLSPVLAGMLGSGERDKEETMNTVNSVVLQFYDSYLKDKGGFSVKDIY